MKLSEYYELIRLADALIILTDSELLSSIIRDAGMIPSSFDFDVLMKIIADAIHSNLTS